MVLVISGIGGRVTSGTSGSILIGVGVHRMNGSPVNPGKQLHMGLWLTTVHSVLTPQVPAQGSTHLLFTHAWLGRHSGWTTHSGRHDGGVPMNPGRQLQDLLPFISRQMALGPHGSPAHG